jgi:Spy/CpxP family protein refolding chaperone
VSNEERTIRGDAMNMKLLMGLAVAVLLIGPGLSSASADEEHGSMMRGRGHEAGAHHESAGHYLRHLLKHPKEIGLTGDQVAKLKAIQLDLDRTRIRTEAEIKVAELELATLVEDEKSDLSAIEAKVKQSETLEIGLRMASIKAKRDALALLTPEQREKEKAEHEKMMQQRAGGMGGGMMGGGHGGPPKGETKKDQKKRDEHAPH